MAKKQASLDHQKVIDARIKEIRVERKGHSKVSMMGHSLDEELARLNRECEGGVEQRKIWDGKVAEIKRVISAETKALKGARTRDSRPPTTPRKDKVAPSQLQHDFLNSPHRTPTRNTRTTVTSPSTPCQKERLEPHQIPFNPTPSKLADIKAFDREHPDGLGLSESEIDSLLDSSCWQFD